MVDIDLDKVCDVSEQIVAAGKNVSCEVFEVAMLHVLRNYGEASPGRCLALGQALLQTGGRMIAQSTPMQRVIATTMAATTSIH